MTIADRIHLGARGDDAVARLASGEFVATAEEIGLVGEITKFTIREGCRLAARRRAVGTGFASLALLRSFPFDYMKIDRSFVTVQSELDRDVLRSLVQLGHSLGMIVITEGIEEPAALEQLRDVGCDVAQGYLLGRPGPADLDQCTSPHPLIAGLTSRI